MTRSLFLDSLLTRHAVPGTRIIEVVLKRLKHQSRISRSTRGFPHLIVGLHQLRPFFGHRRVSRPRRPVGSALRMLDSAFSSFERVTGQYWSVRASILSLILT